MARRAPRSPTKRTTPASSDPKDLNAALEHVLETDEARTRAEAAANQPLSPYVRTVVCSVLIAVGAWLMIAPPAWLLPGAISVPAPPVTARTLAVALVERAEEVVGVYRERGALPATLVEPGPAAEEILYRATSPASFELRVRLGDTTLVLPVTIPSEGAAAYDVQLTPGLQP